MPAIRTEGLRKEFGEGVLAVDDLDLTVEEGEVFGFLGPNGAGKSTTINVLLGFISPTGGEATVLGHDVESESRAIRERVGVLPEGYDVFERLTAREHVSWVIDTKGTSDDPDALLEQVGLADAADRKAGGYSKGMAQRLALAMALVGDPDLLILDEPSSGLDPTGMQEMRSLIREQAKSGTTVFFSSHILSEVEAVCDRVGIMSEGSLVALDSIENLRDQSVGSATIDLEVTGLPDDHGVESIEGVESVARTDDELSVACETAAVKVDVVRHVDSRATVTDIISTDTSLEELFNRYTGNGAAESAPPSDAGEGGERAVPEEVEA